MNNLGVFKRLGRILNVYDSKIDKNGIKIVVGRDTFTLYFNEVLDLQVQKSKISKKIDELHQKIGVLEGNLRNKSFLSNAPKQIVEKEKKALIDYKIELKKLNTIINSIKN